jgi:hypothetical protein
MSEENSSQEQQETQSKQTLGGEQPSTSKAERAANIAASLAFPIVLLVSFVTAYISPFIESSDLTIVAGFAPAQANDWQLTGRILSDGAAVANAKVWVVVSDVRGNQASPPWAITKDDGGFEINSVPRTFGNEAVTEAVIYAMADRPKGKGDTQSKPLKGKEYRNLAGGASLRRIQVSPWKLLPMPVIFLTSILIPFFGRPTLRKHLSLVVLAFIFTASMIVFLSMGLRFVNSTGRQGDVLSLGFASIYQGSYVKDMPEEWIFSLTAPPTILGAPAKQVEVSAYPSGQKDAAAAATPGSSNSAAQPSTTKTNPAVSLRGFGAPLWVMLVSVLGSGIMTIALIVREISDRPTEGDEAKIRARLEKIVLHQFYILFAPVGAVFVYQILVVGEAAVQPLTVALAALGAGASMGGLLDKAVSYSAGLISGAGEAKGTHVQQPSPVAQPAKAG